VIIHTPKTFVKYGWRQLTTWIGFVIMGWFGYSFYADIHTMIHNVLTSAELTQGLVPIFVGAICVIFNRFKPDQKDKSNDNQSDNK
jgi:hypothetical protein